MLHSADVTSAGNWKVYMKAYGKSEFYLTEYLLFLLPTCHKEYQVTFYEKRFLGWRDKNVLYDAFVQKYPFLHLKINLKEILTLWYSLHIICLNILTKDSNFNFDGNSHYGGSLKE